MVVVLPAVAGTPADGVVGVAAPGALPPPAAASKSNEISCSSLIELLRKNQRCRQLCTEPAARRRGVGLVEHSQLHLLAGGVSTLQALGSSSARFLSMVTPRDDESPLSAAQRHCGLDCTTLASCEQHEDGGIDTLPLM